MKALLRHPAVIAFGAVLTSAYIKLCYLTFRWRRSDMAIAEGVWRREGGAIICVWHECIPMGPTAWPPKAGERQELRTLISRSTDGEFITQVMARLGMPAIRGSRDKTTKDGVKHKSGEAALRAMASWVRGGGAVAVTPDGPRGPARVMGEGTPMLARLTGAPVILAGLACNPCIRLKTWDRTVLPVPFARAALTYAGPFFATREDDLTALSATWGAALTEAVARAEALVAD